ncbi:MAG: glycosyltransferase [Ignavibacteriales bacterium]|nr:glycosyltransferase [Ignavibacteriales bacterium]
MKVLHIMPYSPVPPDFGGAMRSYHLLKEMTKRHEVTLLTYGNVNDYIAIDREFRQLQEIHLVPFPWAQKYRRMGQLYAMWKRKSFLRYLVETRYMQRVIDWLVRRNAYDIVQTEFSLMGGFTLPQGPVKILDAHNIEYDNFKRMAANARSLVRKFHYARESEFFHWEELESWRLQDAIFVTSERDREIVQRETPSVPNMVVPNGVDISYFKPSDLQPEPFSLVFTGMMAYVPNYDGILYFLDKIFPLIVEKVPQVKIYVVGNRPPRILQRRASENVMITGYVADVRPYVWRSGVYVVPLRMGGGTRLKVLEAMAMKKPIVTTSIGCEGINGVQGQSLLILDDPKEFAEGVVTLLQDGTLRERLVQAGHELVCSQYDWPVIGKQMENYYQRLVKQNLKSAADQYEVSKVFQGFSEVASERT